MGLSLKISAGPYSAWTGQQSEGEGEKKGVLLPGGGGQLGHGHLLSGKILSWTQNACSCAGGLLCALLLTQNLVWWQEAWVSKDNTLVCNVSQRPSLLGLS